MQIKERYKKQVPSLDSTCLALFNQFQQQFIVIILAGTPKNICIISKKIYSPKHKYELYKWAILRISTLCLRALIDFYRLSVLQYKCSVHGY